MFTEEDYDDDAFSILVIGASAPISIPILVLILMVALIVYLGIIFFDKLREIGTKIRSEK